MLQRLRPLVPVAAVLLGQRAPDGEVVQAAALAGAVGGVGHLAARRPRHQVDALPARPAWPAHAASRSISSDLSARACTLARALRIRPRCADIGEFGYRLDPQIQRIYEPARGRQVWRGLHRRGRGAGVQRVDQDKTGAVPRPRPHREIGQVSQIAYAPRSLGSHAVELGGQPPGPSGAQPWWQLQRAGADDQRGTGVERPHLQVQPVIAEREVAGELESGLADPSAIEIVRRAAVF